MFFKFLILKEKIFKKFEKYFLDIFMNTINK